MKRLALVAFAIALTACGSKNNGDDTHLTTSPYLFEGTWAGEIDGIAPVSVNASQTDSVVSGSATLTYNSTTYNGTFTGISVPPAINLTVTNGDSTGTYAGTWITRDSIAGTFTVGGTTGALSLKQQ
jgi:hypothetical protein